KSDARQRWAAFLAREDGAGRVECSSDQIQVLRQALPECAVESRQSFEHLVRCVSTSIAHLEVDPRTRGYLTTLWTQLHSRKTPDGELPRAETEEGPPPHRQLSQRLQIPRERIPLLFTTLKQVVARCRLAGKAQLGWKTVRSIRRSES